VAADKGKLGTQDADLTMRVMRQPVERWCRELRKEARERIASAVGVQHCEEAKRGAVRKKKRLGAKLS